MNPLYMQQALNYAPQMKQAVAAAGGLRGVAYRLAGFGNAEMAAGVPKWSWFVLGAAAGAVSMWFARKQFERLLSSR